MKFQSLEQRDRKLAADLKAKIIAACHAIESNLLSLAHWLADYQDKKLYRFEYPTFVHFCEAELPFKRSRAYQVIDASITIRALPENVQSTGHLTVADGLALKEVEPAKRVEVLQKAQEAAKSEDRPMTARDIKESAALVNVNHGLQNEGQATGQTEKPKRTGEWPEDLDTPATATVHCMRVNWHSMPEEDRALACRLLNQDRERIFNFGHAYLSASPRDLKNFRLWVSARGGEFKVKPKPED